MDRLRLQLKRLHFAGHMDPVRDWLALIGLAAIILAGIVAWNIWAFDTVANGGVIGAPLVKSEPVFNPASIDTIHNLFTKRAAEEANYRTGTYRFTDPSQ